MYKDNKISVIIPAYNEGKLIELTLSSIPEYIDEIIVVDDGSTDDTYKKIIKKYNKRLIPIRHQKNKGVGAAIVSGYKEFLKGTSTIAVVMAGDNQMDPDDLPFLLNPICDKKCDYIKGNRLYYSGSFKKMPLIRFLGNTILTLLTKIASGYWHLVDFQCGYTAIRKTVLRKINLGTVYQKYGFPNDFLIKLNCLNAKVIDVPVHPVYAQEQSGIRFWNFIPGVFFLLFKGFFMRLWKKNVLYDFHPLVLLYLFGILLTTLGISLGIWILILKFFYDSIATYATIILCALFLITGIQSLLFAMMFDMLNNRHLGGNSK